MVDEVKSGAVGPDGKPLEPLLPLELKPLSVDLPEKEPVKLSVEERLDKLERDFKEARKLVYALAGHVHPQD